MRRDRLAHGWSIAELAQRAKIDAAHLSRVENGRRPPTARIAAALDGVFTERRGWYLTWLEETRAAPEIPVTFRSWSDYEDRTGTLLNTGAAILARRLLSYRLTLGPRHER